MTGQEVKNIIDASICVNKLGAITASALNTTLKLMVDYTSDYMRDAKEFVSIIDDDDWVPIVVASTVGSVFFINKMKYFAKNVDGTIIGIKSKIPIVGAIYLCTSSKLLYTWNKENLIIIPTIGEVTGTAYDGGKGAALKTAYDTHAADASIHLDTIDRSFVDSVKQSTEAEIIEVLG